MEVIEGKRSLTSDDILQELIGLLKQNQMQSQANNVFEICSYVDGLEKKLESVTEELLKVREQIREIKEDTAFHSLKKIVSNAADKVEARCNIMKELIFEVRKSIQTKAVDIIREAKMKGRAALCKVSELFGLKEKLNGIREQVRESKTEAERTIEKIDAFGVGMRAANHQIVNTFRNLVDKSEENYFTVEKKFSKTEMMKKPWEVKKKLFEGMEQQLNAAINNAENLSRNVEIDKMMKQYDTLMEESYTNQRQSIALAAEPEQRYGSEIFESTQRKVNIFESMEQKEKAIVNTVEKCR